MAGSMAGIVLMLLALFFLLRRFRIYSKPLMEIRPGVRTFAAYSLGGLLLFIVVVFIGGYFRWF